MANDLRGGPSGTNKGKSKAELDAIEKAIKEGKTKHQAQAEALAGKIKPIKKTGP